MAVLEAAAQVLENEGAERFTMARVAERAGVSVGSLYQYFPNKASILFRLQSDEWRRTTDRLRALLEDRRTPPLERLRAAVRAFLHSECEEAAVRAALDEAAPLYREAPEAEATRSSGAAAVRALLEETLPDVPEATRLLAGELIKRTLASCGKDFSERPRTKAETDAFAGAMADMFVAYLERLQRG